MIVLAAVPFLVDLPRRIREPRAPSRSRTRSSRSWASPSPGSSIAYTLAIVTGLPVYDRYALPFAPAHRVPRAAHARTAAGSPARTRTRPTVTRLGGRGHRPARVARARATRSTPRRSTARAGRSPRRRRGRATPRRRSAAGSSGSGTTASTARSSAGTARSANAQKLGSHRRASRVVINPQEPRGRGIVAPGGVAARSAASPVPIVARRNKQPCLRRDAQGTAPGLRRDAVAARRVGLVAGCGSSGSQKSRRSSEVRQRPVASSNRQPCIAQVRIAVLDRAEPGEVGLEVRAAALDRVAAGLPRSPSARAVAA